MRSRALPQYRVICFARASIGPCVDLLRGLFKVSEAHTDDSKSSLLSSAPRLALLLAQS